jgi:Ca-activated chloride channel family protein
MPFQGIRASGSRINPIGLLTVLKVLGLALLVLALARPQFATQLDERSMQGIDIVLALDVSQSMNIEDLADRSRLDVAKDILTRFIQGRPNDRVGFVIFSGEPITLAPPTLDHELLLGAVKQADTGLLKDGTAIGEGLALAVSRLRESRTGSSSSKSKVVILLTDGDNNSGQVDPTTAGDMAAGFGIRVYTIAIGKEGRVKLPIRRQNVFGQVVKTYQWQDNALNPELLEKIAEATGGKFYRVTELKVLESVFREIDQLEKTVLVKTEKIQYRDQASLPLRGGVAILVIEWLLENFWWRFLI